MAKDTSREYQTRGTDPDRPGQRVLDHKSGGLRSRESNESGPPPLYIPGLYDILEGLARKHPALEGTNYQRQDIARLILNESREKPISAGQLSDYIPNDRTSFIKGNVKSVPAWLIQNIAETFDLPYSLFIECATSINDWSEYNHSEQVRNSIVEFNRNVENFRNTTRYALDALSVWGGLVQHASSTHSDPVIRARLVIANLSASVAGKTRGAAHAGLKKPQAVTVFRPGEVFQIKIEGPRDWFVVLLEKRPSEDVWDLYARDYLGRGTLGPHGEFLFPAPAVERDAPIATMPATSFGQHQLVAALFRDEWTMWDEGIAHRDGVCTPRLLEKLAERLAEGRGLLLRVPYTVEA